MTYGQLFMTLNPNVKVVENGTCVWIYFDSVNHDTLRVEWWNKEIPDELLKAQEPIKPKVNIDTWICGNCRTRLERQSMIGPNVVLAETFNYCPECGRKVKWDDQAGKDSART